MVLRNTCTSSSSTTARKHKFERWVMQKWLFCFQLLSYVHFIRTVNHKTLSSLIFPNHAAMSTDLFVTSQFFSSSFNCTQNNKFCINYSYFTLCFSSSAYKEMRSLAAICDWPATTSMSSGENIGWVSEWYRQQLPISSYLWSELAFANEARDFGNVFQEYGQSIWMWTFWISLFLKLDKYIQQCQHNVLQSRTDVGIIRYSEQSIVVSKC